VKAIREATMIGCIDRFPARVAAVFELIDTFLDLVETGKL
jgi:hypothetical protein